MNAIENQEAEIKVRDTWTLITIEEALRLDASEIKRCPDCHGRMRAHPFSVTKAKAHFEHLSTPSRLLKKVPYSALS